MARAKQKRIDDEEEQAPAEEVKRRKMRFERLSEHEEKQIDTIVRGLIGAHYSYLAGVRIVALMKLNWSDDLDGKTTILKLVPLNEDIQILLEGFLPEDQRAPDFVLWINKGVWARLEASQRAYVIDQEGLSRISAVDGKDGEQMEREDGVKVWKRSKPEFSGNADPIRRHGAKHLRSTHRFVSVVAAAEGVQTNMFAGESAT